MITVVANIINITLNLQNNEQQNLFRLPRVSNCVYTYALVIFICKMIYGQYLIIIFICIKGATRGLVMDTNKGENCRNCGIECI